MNKLRLGIIGTSEIAYRRFLPALKKCKEIEYVGVASRTIEKTKSFIAEYGGKGYSSYEELIEDSSIDAVYIPLPPALHYKWAKAALESGKHVMLEKPFTTSLEDTQNLINIAKLKNLAVHENYMFLFHNQMEKVYEFIENKTYGKLRQVRITFGFPKRNNSDFRYSKILGGGSLLDCGGYTIKLANRLLGENSRIVSSKLVLEDDYDVDLYGSATLENEKGMTAQISFGMDNEYKCEVEIWKSKGYALFPRIFTAPCGYKPKSIITQNNDIQEILLPDDDQFMNSIRHFLKCIDNTEERTINYNEIAIQANLIEEIRGQGK